MARDITMIRDPAFLYILAITGPPVTVFVWSQRHEDKSLKKGSECVRDWVKNDSIWVAKVERVLIATIFNSATYTGPRNMDRRSGVHVEQACTSIPYNHTFIRVFHSGQK